MSNRDVYERFQEVVPTVKLEDMDIIEVEKAVNVAFKIIGYKPQNFDESFSKAWKDPSPICCLNLFLMCIWRIKNELFMV